MSGLRAQESSVLPAAMGEALPPSAIEGLDMRPWAPLEFSRAWLGKADLVRRHRADLQAAGRLDGARPEDLASLGAALTGQLRIPVIAVRYADVPEPYPAIRLAERLFGASHGDTISLSDYWSEVSGGLLEVDGIVTSWVPLRRSARYYLEGERYGWGEFGKVAEFRRHVLELVDPSLDFSGFDNDGPDGIPNSGDDDGFVDFVAFFYATDCGERGHDGTIWPHRGAMSPIETNDPAAGGGRVRIADYIIMPAVEPSSCDAAHIGVLAHETAHAFGLPDLYDYDGSSRGVGSWGLMGTGSHASSHSPSHPSAWVKEQLGWARVDWVGEDDRGWLPAGRAESRILRHDLTDGSGRYLLMERRSANTSDRDLPGHGLLVWAVDPERGELGIWNEDERRPAVGLLGADPTGMLVSSGGHDFSGPYPGRPQPGTGSERFPVRVGQVVDADGTDVRVWAERSLGWPSGEILMTSVSGGEPVSREVAVRVPHAGTGWLALSAAPWLRLARTGHELRIEADPWELGPGMHEDTVRLVDERTGRIADRLVVRLDVAWSGRGRVLATDLPWSWGLAAVNGDLVHAGLGWDALGLRPRPRLLRIRSGEEFPHTLARLPAEGLYSPVPGPDGSAYVLARARDRNFVYRIDADGSAAAVATDVGNEPAYGLAPLPDGDLLLAGWSGRLYRVQPASGEWSLWADLERPTYQIAADAVSGDVYVALLTGDVLRVTPDGHTTTLQTGFERGRLVAIAVSPDGRVFAAERGGAGRVVQVSTMPPVVLAAIEGGEFYGLAADGLFLYALDLGNRELVRLPIGTPGGRHLATTPDDGTSPDTPPIRP